VFVTAVEGSSARQAEREGGREAGRGGGTEGGRGERGLNDMDR